MRPMAEKTIVAIQRVCSLTVFSKLALGRLTTVSRSLFIRASTRSALAGSREPEVYAAALLAGAGASLVVAASEASSSAISARFSSSSASCGKASPRGALKPGRQLHPEATERGFEAGDNAERGDVLV